MGPIFRGSRIARKMLSPIEKQPLRGLSRNQAEARQGVQGKKGEEKSRKTFRLHAIGVAGSIQPRPRSFLRWLVSVPCRFLFILVRPRWARFRRLTCMRGSPVSWPMVLIKAERWVAPARNLDLNPADAPCDGGAALVGDRKRVELVDQFGEVFPQRTRRSRIDRQAESV